MKVFTRTKILSERDQLKEKLSESEGNRKLHGFFLHCAKFQVVLFHFLVGRSLFEGKPSLNNNNNSTNIYYVHVRYYSKCFTGINLFNLHKTSPVRCSYNPHLWMRTEEIKGQIICPWSQN